MTTLYWVEYSTPLVLNVFINFDTGKNIENCNFLEEKSVKIK